MRYCWLNIWNFGLSDGRWCWLRNLYLQPSEGKPSFAFPDTCLSSLSSSANSGLWCSIHVPEQHFVCIPCPSMRTKCLVLLIILHFDLQINILWRGKIWSCSLCGVFRSVTFSVLYIQTFLSTRCSQTSSVYAQCEVLTAVPMRMTVLCMTLHTDVSEKYISSVYHDHVDRMLLWNSGTYRKTRRYIKGRLASPSM